MLVPFTMDISRPDLEVPMIARFANKLGNLPRPQTFALTVTATIGSGTNRNVHIVYNYDVLDRCVLH
jgi:hypothetical protein